MPYSELVYVPINYGAAVAVAAGTGGIQRFSYTVPTNKRALLNYVGLALNENTMLTFAAAGIVLRVGPTSEDTFSLYTMGGVAYRTIAIAPNIELFEGQSIQLLTVNGTASIVNMIYRIQLKEYA